VRFGDSPLVAAVSMLPLGAALLPMSRLAPKLVARSTTRIVCIGGLGLIAAALFVLAQLHATSPYGLMAAALVVLGVGMGAAMTPATSAITAALPDAQQGVGSALNDLAREVGGAMGIAVIGSILTSSYHSHLTLRGVPAPLVAKARESVALAAHAGGTVAIRADAAFVSALHIALLRAAGAVVLAGAGVSVLRSRSSGEEAEPGK
jgi:MFS family permease